MNRNVMVSSSAPRRIEEQPALPGVALDVRPGEHVGAPQSGHVAGSGSRTSTANCVWQPRHSPATVFRRSGNDAGRMRSQQPAASHVFTARGTTSSVPAASSSQPMTSPASSAQPSASIGARTSHLNRSAVARVGHRQQGSVLLGPPPGNHHHHHLRVVPGRSGVRSHPAAAGRTVLDDGEITSQVGIRRASVLARK